MTASLEDCRWASREDACPQHFGNGPSSTFVSATRALTKRITGQRQLLLRRTSAPDGEISWSCTPENPVYIGGRAAKQICTICSIGDEATGIDEVAGFVDRRESSLGGEIDNARPLAHGKRIDQYQQRIRLLTDDGIESRIQLACISRLH
jgi:hypothetical protein